MGVFEASKWPAAVRGGSVSDDGTPFEPHPVTDLRASTLAPQGGQLDSRGQALRRPGLNFLHGGDA